MIYNSFWARCRRERNEKVRRLLGTVGGVEEHPTRRALLCCRSELMMRGCLGLGWACGFRVGSYIDNGISNFT